ncbi:MAG: hypothetical protein ABSF46_31935, partial [Terriglobia bacterium]
TSASEDSCSHAQETAQASQTSLACSNLDVKRHSDSMVNTRRKAAVVVAADEWERKTRRKGNLAEFFASSPLRRSGLKIARLRGGLRKAGL